MLCQSCLFSGIALAGAVYVDPVTDAEHLSTFETIVSWNPVQQVAGYRNIDKIGPTRKIKAGGNVYPLTYRKTDFSDFRYEVDGKSMSIDDFVDTGYVTGLIIVKDDQILLERYTAGNDENSRWMSFSVAKSVTSLLVGVAIQDGYIKSVDESIADYLPGLKGTSYERASVRNVLQMASGVEWNEDYSDPTSDVLTKPGGVVKLVNFLGGKKRVAEPGVKFNYNTGETNLTGAVLRAAIGNNLSTYLTDKIWIPFGMESDANWLQEAPLMGERGGTGISATLRDYARIGIFALREGKLLDGTEVLAPGWMKDSTTPSKGFPGYGYLWWLGDEGIYRGVGIFGQALVIDPNKNVVIVTHSACPNAVGKCVGANRTAFFDAILKAL